MVCERICRVRCSCRVNALVHVAHLKGLDLSGNGDGSAGLATEIMGCGSDVHAAMRISVVV